MAEYTCPRCDAGVSFKSRNRVPRRITCPSCKRKFSPHGNEGNPHGVIGAHHADIGTVSYKAIGIFLLIMVVFIFTIYFLNTH